jgi:hypothetical protein
MKDGRGVADDGRCGGLTRRREAGGYPYAAMHGVGRAAPIDDRRAAGGATTTRRGARARRRARRPASSVS